MLDNFYKFWRKANGIRYVYRIICIGIFLISLLFLFITSLLSTNSPKATELLNYMLTLANTFVILITGFFVAWYTVETYKLRVDGVKPIISIIYNPSYTNFFIENIGRGAALNIKLEIENPSGNLEDISYMISSKNLKYDASIEMNQNIKLIGMYHRSLIVPKPDDWSKEEQEIFKGKEKKKFIAIAKYEDIYENCYQTTVQFSHNGNRFVIDSTKIISV